MKGLFNLDLQYLISQRKVLISMLFACVIFVISGNIEFIGIFIPLLILIILARTITIELTEPDSRFLFTLPFSRLQYALEKYLLILGGGLASCIIFALISFLINGAQIVTLTETLVPSMTLVVVGASVLTPFYMKYRGNAQIMSMIISLGIIGLAIPLQGYAQNYLPVISAFRESQPVLSVVIAAAVIGLLLVISYLTSMNILKKEEF